MSHELDAELPWGRLDEQAERIGQPVRLSRDPALMSTDYTRERLNTILKALGFGTFGELASTPAEKVVERIDSVDPAPPINAADAFMAVMVVSAVAHYRLS